MEILFRCDHCGGTAPEAQKHVRTICGVADRGPDPIMALDFRTTYWVCAACAEILDRKRGV